MNTKNFYTLFFVALAISLVLGIERAWKQRAEYAGERGAGIRTFTLLALIGFAAGAASECFGAVLPSVWVSALSPWSPSATHRHGARNQTAA